MGMLYDDCGSEHDCESNDCQTFAPEGFNACSPRAIVTQEIEELSTQSLTRARFQGEQRIEHGWPHHAVSLSAHPLP